MDKKDKDIFDHKSLDKYWQNQWLEYETSIPDILNPKKKYYNLWMFPYPSAEGLHAGHAFSSTGSDVYGRYKRMNGYDVFQPIGYDSFGIHSENFALKAGKHPSMLIYKTTKNYEKQLKSLGHGYDWKRTVTTSDANYYKWTQWLFVEMFKAGLAYKKKATVNWCPSCKTVLADEQVMTPVQAGKDPKDSKGNIIENKQDVRVCERCGTVVEKKDLDQWFFRITDYADELLANLGKINWPDKIKIAQKNWIGKKEGINITYPIKDYEKEITVWTSRPDTNFGATFIVVSPEFAQIDLLDLIPDNKKDDVNNYINISLKKTKDDRIEEGRNKTGVFIGLYAINQLNGYEMPIWVADFVLPEVGTGAVVGVPGHDRRDFEFASEFGLEIKRVVVGSDNDESDITKIEQVQEDNGRMVNSDFLNNINIQEAIKKMMDYLEERGWGKRATNYHLRDWLVSRQRYWGTPIPMIYCQKCANEGKRQEVKDKRVLHKDQSDWNPSGWYPEENLPVELPDIEDFKPEGEGRGPLANHPEFYKRNCPECGRDAIRETDVMDTFVDSSWYFLAYPMQGTKEWERGPSTRSARSGHDLLINKIIESWLPVDLYFGGAEHSVLHLMYARFVWMMLKDLDYLNFESNDKTSKGRSASGWDEPFPWFYAHGLMIKDGAKMSKSRGNVVNPDEYIEKFGADTLRLYLMFMGPMDGYPDFRDTGIEGMRRFVDRVWNLCTHHKNISISDDKDVKKIQILMHRTIIKATNDIQNFRYNTAISAIMEYVNLLRDLSNKYKVGKQHEQSSKIVSPEWNTALKTLILLLAPFAPHMTEEVWVKVLGQKFSIHKTAWPKADLKIAIEEKITIAVQINGKLRATIEMDTRDAMQKDVVINSAKSNEKVKVWLEDKVIQKEVFVPGKILNIVIKG